MEMITLWEQEEDGLRTALAGAKRAEEAAAALKKTADRLLARYNEACASAAGREAASAMTAVWEAALPLADTAGETRIWERSAESGGKPKGRRLRRGLLISAVVLFLAGLGLVVWAVLGEAAPWLLGGAAGALTAGFGLFFLAGRLFAPRRADGVTRQAEVLPDVPKILRTARAVCLVMDRQLAETIREEEMREKMAAAGAVSRMSDAEKDLYADLLEALYSRDGAFALDRLEDVVRYLRAAGVDVLDYSDENRAWFDMLPAKEAGTLRPALASEGKLLRRGMASRGKGDL